MRYSKRREILFQKDGVFNNYPIWRYYPNMDIKFRVPLQLQVDCNLETHAVPRRSQGCFWVVKQMPVDLEGKPLFVSTSRANDPSKVLRWKDTKRLNWRITNLFQPQVQQQPKIHKDYVPANIITNPKLDYPKECEGVIEVVGSFNYHFNTFYSGAYHHHSYVDHLPTFTKDHRSFIRWQNNIFPHRSLTQNGWVIMAKDGTIRFYSLDHTNCPYEVEFEKLYSKYSMNQLFHLSNFSS